ncbi:hypothetical protein HYC85_001513 [Camellia sinensis]|uniref:Receptor ligand binding region domain-containing protein n=1 Tax=Camellia sinensis TaxID=4442 RepID=A0A7J7I7H0_CAMSI|nr:hypothetical protein HYC85_001513 [Camellia sinensis]
MQANFLIHLGEEAHVPIISFSATSSSLSYLRSPYFFRAALNDSSQVQPITAIIQAFGWKEVVPIYTENEYGEGLIPFLTDAFQENEIRVLYKSIIHPMASDEEIVAELYKLMTMQTQVFVVHMTCSLSARLFTKANEIGMMSEGESAARGRRRLAEPLPWCAPDPQQLVSELGLRKIEFFPKVPRFRSAQNPLLTIPGGRTPREESRTAKTEPRSLHTCPHALPEQSASATVSARAHTCRAVTGA